MSNSSHQNALHKNTQHLSAKNLGLGYERSGKWQQVLQDFSCQLEAGKTLVVLGPSGVGKSSLLRVLAGLQKPAQGQVFWQGKPLTGPQPSLGFMFQEPNLLPWLSLAANVGLGLKMRHQPRLSRSQLQARINQALAEVNLTDYAKAKPAQISGGMAQRVALARCLARQPQVLFLDEPFSALDEVTRAQMQQLVLSLKQRHHTALVLVTHNLDEALLLADKILLLGSKPGRLLASWDINLTQPRHLHSSRLAALRLEIMQQLNQASCPEVEPNNLSFEI